MPLIEYGVSIHPYVAELVDRLADEYDQSRATILREVVHAWYNALPGQTHPVPTTTLLQLIGEAPRA